MPVARTFVRRDRPSGSATRSYEGSPFHIDRILRSQATRTSALALWLRTPSLPALQLTLVPFTLAMASVAATSYALRCREHGTGRLSTVAANAFPARARCRKHGTGRLSTVLRMTPKLIATLWSASPGHGSLSCHKYWKYNSLPYLRRCTACPRSAYS